jgi:DNA-binding NarL/FixJ family response regulator
VPAAPGRWTERDSGTTEPLRTSARPGPAGLVLAPGGGTLGGRWAAPREGYVASGGRTKEGLERPLFEILLILVGEVSDETLSWMRRAAVRSSDTPARIVLVADSITESQLLRAAGYGLTSFLQRQQAGFAQVLRAVVNSRDGRPELPDTVITSLVQQLRTAQQGHSGPGGLTPREAEVLLHLADGLDTSEIASRLSYSERTIKNIIHSLISRLGLRNRTHAVAHGIRSGLI